MACARASALLLMTLAATTACSLVKLVPGASEVKITTNPADLAGCTEVGIVSGVAANISTSYAHQMQNQAVGMEADTVYVSGNGGIAYRCRQPNLSQ
jgi:hypothetical protein